MTIKKKIRLHQELRENHQYRQQTEKLIKVKEREQRDKEAQEEIDTYEKTIKS